MTDRWNKPVEVWEVKTGRLRHKIETPSVEKDCGPLATLLGGQNSRSCVPEASDPVNNLIFLPDGSGLVSFAFWGRIFIWDTETGKLSRKVFQESNGSIVAGEVPYTTVTFPFISHKREILVTPSHNGRAGFWSLPQMKWLGATTPPFLSVALGVIFSTNEQKLAVQGLTKGYDECGVLLWSLKRMIPIANWEKLPRSITMMFTPDDRVLIIAETDKKKRRPARIYDTERGDSIGELATLPFLQAGFSSDGRLFYSLAWNQDIVTLWDVVVDSGQKN